MVQILADNTGYLTIDGYDVSGIATELSIEGGGSSNEQPYGFGSTYTRRTPGLKDVTINATIIYDQDNIDSYITSIASQQIVAVVAGPEGNTAGKPKHAGNFVVDSVNGPTKAVTKDAVLFEITLVTADPPTDDLFAGATF